MRFSVVIPTRCRPGLVVQAVQSVLRQTVGAHEVVMIIDGVDPSTEQALRSFPAVTVVALPTNKGVAEARNIGVRAATGNWMCFLDDDLWSPNHLEVCGLWADLDRDAPPHRSLREYGFHYRVLVQGVFWLGLKRRRLDDSITALRLGWSIQPRRRDRIYCLSPAPLTLRWEFWQSRDGQGGNQRDRE